MTKRSLDTATLGLPLKRAIAHPYPAADAGMHVFFNQHKVVKARRHRLTDGSSWYTVRVHWDVNQVVALGIIGLRAIGTDGTLIHATGTQQTLEADEFTIPATSVLRAVIENFSKWLDEDQRQLRNLLLPASEPEPYEAEAEHLLEEIAEIQAQSAHIGRPPEPHNQWARDEIAQGKNRDDIFKEYMKKVDPEGNMDVDQLKERFRKALSRTKRTK